MPSLPLASAWHLCPCSAYTYEDNHVRLSSCILFAVELLDEAQMMPSPWSRLWLVKLEYVNINAILLLVIKSIFSCRWVFLPVRLMKEVFLLPLQHYQELFHGPSCKTCSTGAILPLATGICMLSCSDILPYHGCNELMVHCYIKFNWITVKNINRWLYKSMSKCLNVYLMAPIWNIIICVVFYEIMWCIYKYK